jgi:glycosyltransferase involved in cell wall biosynthesis
MRVAALVHFSVIWRSCGSEVVLHELLKAAKDAGHEVTCWVTNRDSARSWRGHEPDEFLDGVRYVRVRNPVIGGRQVQAFRPDVVVSHHQHVLHALRVARSVRARSVFLTHNQMDLNDRPLRMKPDLVIHNSEWVRESLSRFGTPTHEFVMHPPLTPDRHTVPSTGDALTLINLNRDKGAEVFYRLAELMPDRKFLGVVGGHGEQVVRMNLPNVEILEHGPDMKRVWSRTRVLLMPSIYESYGLTAVEAGINGIPTIANPTPGLKENLGERGLFADRDSIVEWAYLIENYLDDPLLYENASNAARSLADDAMRDTRDTLKQWVEWIG